MIFINLANRVYQIWYFFVGFDKALSKHFKYLLEVQILEGEMDFYNTSGFHTCP